METMNEDEGRFELQVSHVDTCCFVLGCLLLLQVSYGTFGPELGWKKHTNEVKKQQEIFAGRDNAL